MRAIDEPIGADESLYRGVGLADVDANGMLFETAVDAQGMSCARSKYDPAGTSACIAARRINGLVVTTPGELPQQPLNVNGVYWIVFAADAPTPDSDAHAEIRARRPRTRGANTR